MVHSDCCRYLLTEKSAVANIFAERLFPLFILFLLSACAQKPTLVQATEPSIVHCLEMHRAIDRAVAVQGVTPSSPAHIQHYPYLRVNRFLASFSEEPLNKAQRAAWLARLAALAIQARKIELNSLPSPVRLRLQQDFATDSNLAVELTACAEKLQQYDMAHPHRLDVLQTLAKVPPDYNTLKRIVGLYPLTALPVRMGIQRWHQETRETFEALSKISPKTISPKIDKLRRYQPPTMAITEPLSLARDALKIPNPSAAQLAALFSLHAPVWEIITRGPYDLPGTPVWHSNGLPSIDSSTPVVYRYASYTRWWDDILLQLNYLIWFSERPRNGMLDILNGALDGLIWRVTLDHDSTPLLYDSIHPCGCYHLFFPTPKLRLRRHTQYLPEPPLVPQVAPQLAANERMVIQVATQTHFIQGLYANPATGVTYNWRDYDALYATPTYSGSHHSLFESNGIVAGTERAERWLLWPMGIASPGAMRERGRQATAFVGKRHFDDARLLQHLFQSNVMQPSVK